MFVLNNTTNISGTSLITELPFLTCDRMIKLFGRGAGMNIQRRHKYSNSIVVQNERTGECFSLYMSFGVWRIGGRDTSSSLGELMEFLCPVEYQGYGDLSHSAIQARCKHGIPKEPVDI